MAYVVCTGEALDEKRTPFDASRRSLPIEQLISLLTVEYDGLARSGVFSGDYNRLPGLMEDVLVYLHLQILMERITHGVVGSRHSSSQDLVISG